jgi:hypothetical protein
MRLWIGSTNPRPRSCNHLTLNHARLHRLPQVHPIHKFHQQVVEPAGLAEVMDGDDIRMVQLGQSLRLAREAFGEPWVAHAFGSEQCERNETVE